MWMCVFFQATIWLKHRTHEHGRQLMGQWWTSVWFVWMATANGRVNHTEAQADAHVHSDKVKGGHAWFVLRWGMQGVLDFCRSRPKQDETGYQDKLTLNSSTSSSCKQEAWRLKRDLETSSRLREQEVETRLCRGHATTNKQKMTGDGRTPDIGHLPISSWRLCVLALCIHTHYNNNECVVHKHLSHVISCKMTTSLSPLICSMVGVSAGGSHAPQQWQTVINKHKLSDTNYTLQLASILPSVPVNPCLVSWCGYIPGQECNPDTEREPWTGHGSEWELTEPDVECVPDPAGEGSRLAGGGMVLWFPFCQHL